MSWGFWLTCLASLRCSWVSDLGLNKVLKMNEWISSELSSQFSVSRLLCVTDKGSYTANSLFTGLDRLINKSTYQRHEIFPVKREFSICHPGKRAQLLALACNPRTVYIHGAVLWISNKRLPVLRLTKAYHTRAHCHCQTNYLGWIFSRSGLDVNWLGNSLYGLI